MITEAKLLAAAILGGVLVTKILETRINLLLIEAYGTKFVLVRPGPPATPSLSRKARAYLLIFPRFLLALALGYAVPAILIFAGQQILGVDITHIVTTQIFSSATTWIAQLVVAVSIFLYTFAVEIEFHTPLLKRTLAKIVKATGSLLKELFPAEHSKTWDDTLEFILTSVAARHGLMSFEEKLDEMDPEANQEARFWYDTYWNDGLGFAFGCFIGFSAAGTSLLIMAPALVISLLMRWRTIRILPNLIYSLRSEMEGQKKLLSFPAKPTAPCPFCGKPLRTPRAKQCRHCKRRWHDLDEPAVEQPA